MQHIVEKNRGYQQQRCHRLPRKGSCNEGEQLVWQRVCYCMYTDKGKLKRLQTSTEKQCKGEATYLGERYTWDL